MIILFICISIFWCRSSESLLLVNSNQHIRDNLNEPKWKFQADKSLNFGQEVETRSGDDHAHDNRKGWIRKRIPNFLRRGSKSLERPSASSRQSTKRSESSMISSHSSNPERIFEVFIVPMVLLKRPSLQDIVLDSWAHIPPHSGSEKQVVYKYFLSALDTVDHRNQVVLKEPVRCHVNVLRVAEKQSFAIQDLVCERVIKQEDGRTQRVEYYRQNRQAGSLSQQQKTQVHSEQPDSIDHVFQNLIIPQVRFLRPNMEDIRLKESLSHHRASEYRFTFSALDTIRSHKDKDSGGHGNLIRKNIVLCKVTARRQISGDSKNSQFFIQNIECELLSRVGQRIKTELYYHHSSLR